MFANFDVGDHFIADDDEFAATILADGFGVQFDAFEDVGERENEMLGGDADQQAVDDGEREREF